MRLFAFFLLAFSALVASGKGLHVRYVAQLPEGLSEEQQALLPEAWDLYMTDEGFRMEEVGGAQRVWVGAAGAESVHILIEFFGQTVALIEPCAEPTPWKKGVGPDASELAAFDGWSPNLAGEAAVAYEHDGKAVWLAAARLEAPCMWGFPRLPLAFPLPDAGSADVWMVAESIGATERPIDFSVPEGYERITTDELGRLIPDLKLAE